MNPILRRRYEVVQTQDLVDYFVALNITPTCSQCQGTKFHIPTIRSLSIGPEGDQQNGSPERASLEPFEMQGAYSNGPAYYALTCEYCGTIFNVNALGILLWTEEQRQHQSMKAVAFGEEKADLISEDKAVPFGEDNVGERHE